MFLLDFNLLTASYPSNGPIFMFILKMMEQLNAKEEDFKSAEYYHRLLEVRYFQMFSIYYKSFLFKGH